MKQPKTLYRQKLKGLNKGSFLQIVNKSMLMHMQQPKLETKDIYAFKKNISFLAYICPARFLPNFFTYIYIRSRPLKHSRQDGCMADGHKYKYLAGH